jgi:hypothetical protein
VPGFGPSGAVAGIAVLVVLLGGLLWAAAAGHTVSAQTPDLFGGYLVLEDDAHPLPVIDLATGEVTVRLDGVTGEVGATSYQDVATVPLSVGTMLVNRVTGTFNLLAQDNYLVDSAGAGVGLGTLANSTGAQALAAGSSAYIVRTAPHSTVSLVDEDTVEAGAKLEASTSGSHPAVTPRGFAALTGSVADETGSAAVAGNDLWVLVGDGSRCQVTQLTPVAAGHNGLTAATRTTLGVACDQATIESEAGDIGVSWPGHVDVFTPDSSGKGLTIKVSGTSADNQVLPVRGAVHDFWYLGHDGAGWSIFGTTPAGRVSKPVTLTGFSRDADPVPPVESSGMLYSLDQTAKGQPTLWTITPGGGAMSPVAGTKAYPARSATEKASFVGAQVLVDGPRVIFNNPGSLLAVVVFTDGSRKPVTVDKSTAVELSATGPNVVQQNATANAGKGHTGVSPSGPKSVPVVQAVSQSVTCANTTEKPYAPQITSITPSSGSALVAWSYQLLDATDCEPDSWSVQVSAISGSHQPSQPVQTINGQDQLDFTGLRPSTTYQVTVTAYINTQSTVSTAATFSTTARGPDAPVTVQTTSDGKGDWIVSWTPCTSSNCIVPADEWDIVGTACGGSYVPDPPSVQVGGSQDTVTISAGNLSLLGDSMSFSVKGQLASGLLGNPTSDHACTQAWQPPTAADISLAASGAASGTTVTATLQVSTSGGVSQVQALGSDATQYVYRVGSVAVGPTASPKVTVPGLAAGASYTPTVQVYPAGHPSAYVTVAGQSFTQNVQWPSNLGVSAGQVVADQSNPNNGEVGLVFANLPAGKLALASGSYYTCGSTQVSLSGALMGEAFGIGDVNLLEDPPQPCQVTAVLEDESTPNPFGGITDSLSTTFDITTSLLPHYSLSAAFPPGCFPFCLQQQITVSAAAGQTFAAGGNWQIATNNDEADGYGDCDTGPTALATPPQWPYTVTLPIDCGPAEADATTVTITYTYLGQAQTISMTSSNQTGTTLPSTTTTSSSTTSTTLVPCDSTTTVTSTSTSTSTTVPCSNGADLAGSGGTSGGGVRAVDGSARTDLAATQAAVGPLSNGDAQIRDAFSVGVLAVGGLWVTGIVRRARRRRSRRKELA